MRPICLAAAALGLAAYRVFGAPRVATLGATPAEADLHLPGDDVVPDPATVTTRAASIDAPPAEVWRWLVQVGTDRGGWYSHELLERFVGVPVHNTDELRPEWQHLAVGDRVQLAPPGWLGTPGMVMPIADLRDGGYLVLRQQPPDSPWDGVWSFHLLPSEDGGTRMLIRSRTAVPAGPVARLVGVLFSPIADGVTALMELGMLAGLRERAERSSESIRSEKRETAAT